MSQRLRRRRLYHRANTVERQSCNLAAVQFYVFVGKNTGVRDQVWCGVQRFVVLDYTGF